MENTVLSFLPRLLLLLACPYGSPLGVIGATQQKSALIIIDVQDCFLPGGSLAVDDGGAVIPVINSIRSKYGDKFSLVVLSKDWHLPGHVSFASSHPGKNVLDVINLQYEDDGTLCRGGTVSSTNFPRSDTCTVDTKTRTLSQTLWPVHCVQNVTTGPTSSEIADSLYTENSDVIIYKGTRLELDSYSAFFDNGKFGQTQLDAILKSKGINQVFVTGLALDFCVYYTSLDAKSLGYETYTVTDAARGVAKSSVDDAVLDMANHGIHLITSDVIGDILSSTDDAPTMYLSSKLFAMMLVTTALANLCM